MNAFFKTDFEFILTIKYSFEMPRDTDVDDTKECQWIKKQKD